MDFKDIVQKRRSIRKFTEQPLTEDEKRAILRAALMAPTGHGVRGWHFVVVEDKYLLQQISHCKDAGGEFLAGAAMAVIVAYDVTESDVWVEDASIAAVTMQYQATELGLGSCWSQIRERKDTEGIFATTNLRQMMALPQEWEVECIIGFGHPAIERKLQDEEKLKWDNVIYK